MTKGWVIFLVIFCVVDGYFSIKWLVEDTRERRGKVAELLDGFKRSK